MINKTRPSQRSSCSVNSTSSLSTTTAPDPIEPSIDAPRSKRSTPVRRQCPRDPRSMPTATGSVTTKWTYRAASRFVIEASSTTSGSVGPTQAGGSSCSSTGSTSESWGLMDHHCGTSPWTQQRTNSHNRDRQSFVYDVLRHLSPMSRDITEWTFWDVTQTIPHRSGETSLRPRRLNRKCVCATLQRSRPSAGWTLMRPARWSRLTLRDRRSMSLLGSSGSTARRLALISFAWGLSSVTVAWILIENGRQSPSTSRGNRLRQSGQVSTAVPRWFGSLCSGREERSARVAGGRE